MNVVRGKSGNAGKPCHAPIEPGFLRYTPLIDPSDIVGTQRNWVKKWDLRNFRINGLVQGRPLAGLGSGVRKDAMKVFTGRVRSAIAFDLNADLKVTRRTYSSLLGPFELNSLSKTKFRDCQLFAKSVALFRSSADSIELVLRQAHHTSVISQD